MQKYFIIGIAIAVDLILIFIAIGMLHRHLNAAQEKGVIYTKKEKFYLYFRIILLAAVIHFSYMNFQKQFDKLVADIRHDKKVAA